MHLIIDRQQNVVSLVTGFSANCIGTIPCALGNILFWLEEEFPRNEYGTKEYIVHRTFQQNAQTKNYMGLLADSLHLNSFYSFVNNQDEVELSLQEIELHCAMCNFNIQHLPLKNFDYYEGFDFKHINSLYEVIYSLLYYYAFNKLKIARCAHCGRWFATKSFKIRYCPRQSTFPGYTHLPCAQAVKNIRQECGRVRNRIETKANATISVQLHENPFVDTFFKEAEQLYRVQKKLPSVENLGAYYSFLQETEKKRGWL